MMKIKIVNCEKSLLIKSQNGGATCESISD